MKTIQFLSVIKILALTVISALVITACGNNSGGSSSPQPQPQPQPIVNPNVVNNNPCYQNGIIVNQGFCTPVEYYQNNGICYLTSTNAPIPANFCTTSVNPNFYVAHGECFMASTSVMVPFINCTTYYLPYYPYYPGY
jgi:hypothetical protein